MQRRYYRRSSPAADKEPESGALIRITTGIGGMAERRNTSMHNKPLEPHELDKIATATLAHYEQHAD